MPIHRLCHINAIPDNNVIGLDMDGQPVIAAKWKGEVFLYHNHCPHMGTTLDWQPNDFLNFDRTHLQCSTHSAEFEIDTGKCIYGPCVGRYLETILFRIEGDHIVVDA